MSTELGNLNVKTSDLGNWPKFGLIAGVVGLALTALSALFHGTEVFRSYLVGFMFWFNISAGCLFWLMVQHLSGGAWGIMIRRVIESGAKMIVPVMVLFIPVLVGMGSLYEWTHTADVQKDAVLAQKQAYLNIPGFVIRLIIYIIVWGGLAWYLASVSSKQDKTIDPRHTISMKRTSGVGLVLLFLTMTFAAIDWMLSLEPHFFSSMYGPVVMAGQALGSMSFVVAVMVLLVRVSPLRDRVTSGHVWDLGNFMLATTMFWAYVNFSQFLIIWSANIAEEAPYYLRRMSGGWGWIGGFLIAFHFFTPFFMLLNRSVKKNINALVKVAIFILFLRFMDLCFLILPSGHQESEYQGHLDIVSILVAAFAVVGVGGLWLFLFFRFIVARPLLPVNEPYLQEALDFRGGH